MISSWGRLPEARIYATRWKHGKEQVYLSHSYSERMAILWGLAQCGYVARVEPAYGAVTNNVRMFFSPMPGAVTVLRDSFLNKHNLAPVTTRKARQILARVFQADSVGIQAGRTVAGYYRFLRVVYKMTALEAWERVVGKKDHLKLEPVQTVGGRASAWDAALSHAFKVA